MKKIYKPLIFSFLILIFSSLQSIAAVTECDSINMELTSKFRFLGSWDANGVPDYLQPDDDEVSQALINFVKSTLPESVNLPESNDEYFGDDIQFNTELNEASEVYLTMVDEGAGWTNSLGFYTYDINNPPATVYDIDSLVIIFPNVSQPEVVLPGNKVLLGNFPAHTGIGYFLIAPGWVGDTICIQSHIVFSDPNLNTFTTQKYRQQTILLNYEQEEKFLLSFEDIKRPAGDNDFNDAVFYITADPNAIDTTDIPKIPTAHLSGDTTMCDENAAAKLKVELSGQAPWTIVYSNGIEQNEIAGIQQAVYVFETTLKDSITLISVKDKYKFGIVDGHAVVDVTMPTATIEDYAINCGEKEAVIPVSLAGNGPWEISYSINGEILTEVSSENSLNITINQQGKFELLEVNDAYCTNQATGILEIKFLEKPFALIVGDAIICNEEEATILVNLTGTPPYSFVYTDGETETAITTSENSYSFTTNAAATYSLISVDDANCSGEVSGTAKITDGSEGIQVEIDANENSCFGEEIELTLLGETDNLSVIWSTEGKGSLSSTDQITTIYTPKENETGIIVFYAEVNNTCIVKTISQEVNIVDKIDASFEYSPSDNLLTNSLITFIPSNNGYDEYNWEFGDGNSSTAAMASTEYDKGGKYKVKLEVIHSGCEGEGSADLEVLSKDELYVPNAFNPSAVNPENQVVKVYGNNVSENGFAFKIVNRWGKVMYKTNSFAEANTIGWNGINNNNDVEQELNVFTYLLRGQFIEGEEFQKVGTITQVK